MPSPRAIWRTKVPSGRKLWNAEDALCSELHGHRADDERPDSSVDSPNGSGRDGPRKENDAAAAGRGRSRRIQPLDGRHARAARAQRLARARDAGDLERSLQECRKGKAGRPVVDRRRWHSCGPRSRPPLDDGERVRRFPVSDRPRSVALGARLRRGPCAPPLRFRLPRPARRDGQHSRRQRGRKAHRRSARIHRVRARTRGPLSRRRLCRRATAPHGQGDLAGAMERGARVPAACRGRDALMFGPRIQGRNGVSLVPPTLEDFKLHVAWELQPEVGRFWGPRFGEMTADKQEERFKKTGADQSQLMWTIAYEDEPVGYTGIFGIDWVRRDGESGIFIGRHDLFGRGIASEAVRLRTRFAWDELRMHRVHNWI